MYIYWTQSKFLRLKKKNITPHEENEMGSQQARFFKINKTLNTMRPCYCNM